MVVESAGSTEDGADVIETLVGPLDEPLTVAFPPQPVITSARRNGIATRPRSLRIKVHPREGILFSCS
jgi:hypothetical protein